VAAYCVSAVDKMFGVFFEEFVDDKASFKEDGAMKCVPASVVLDPDGLLISMASDITQVAASDGSLQQTIFLLRKSPKYHRFITPYCGNEIRSSVS